MVRTSKFFALAKENNITPFELKYSNSSSLSLRVYQDELEGNTLASDSGIVGRGLYNGKVGFFASDKCDSSVAPMMIQHIKDNAKYGLEVNPDFFIDKGRSYKRINRYNKALDDVKSEDLIALLKRISKELRARDERIKIAEVYFDLSSSEFIMENSKGLKLRSKDNYATIYASVKVQQGEEVETYGDYRLITNLEEFDEEAFIDSIVKESVRKLGGESIKSGKYNVLFTEDCVASLVKCLLGNFSAFALEQHLSLFEGKLGTQVFSKKLTITENPHTKTVFGRNFDAEGIPTTKKELISKGVLKTFVYDLDTASRAGVESTGNAVSAGPNRRPAVGYVEVKKGRTPKAEVIKSMKKGVIITDLNGLGTGLNRQSGSYSLQAEGFYVENGEIVRPVSLITVAGNLIEDFNKIISVCSDSKLTMGGVDTPAILVRSMSISGK